MLEEVYTYLMAKTNELEKSDESVVEHFIFMSGVDKSELHEFAMRRVVKTAAYGVMWAGASPIEMQLASWTEGFIYGYVHANRKELFDG